MHQDIDASRTTRSIRSAIAATSLAAGAAMLLAPIAAGAQEAPDEAGAAVSLAAEGPITSIGGNITIDDRTAPSQAACITSDQAFVGIPLLAQPQWQIYPQSTDDQFILKVIATAPLCAPVRTTAAIYKMPNGGEWPQQVAEQISFTLQNPGEIIVTFDKQCERVQYDLLAGEGAPSPINIGPDHQLLFPLRLDTALQYFASAAKCQPTTVPTTAAPTSAAPTSAAPTTASPTTAVVLGSTTIPSDVLAATTVPGGPGNAAANTNRGAALAATGNTSLPMTAAGVGMVIAGGALVATRRRKLASEA